jgi:hypothetical protein
MNLRRQRNKDDKSQETVYPPKKYLITYVVGMVISFYPLTLYAPVDTKFPAALAVSGALLILASVYVGRGIYRYQPLATLPYYILNAALFSGVFGAVLLVTAGLRFIFG